MPGLWCTQRIWYSRLLSQVLRETWLWVNGGCDITRNQNTKIHDARCGNTPFKGSHSVKHRHSVLSCVQEIFRHGEATILMWLSWDLEPIQVGSHVGGTTKARRFSNCDAKLRPRRGKRWKQNASCPGENPIKCNLWIFDDLWCLASCEILQVIASVAGRVVGVDQQPELVAQEMISDE